MILAALLATLPVIEAPSSTPSPTMAVLVSGDGGWARIDRELAARLNAAGISVVGLDAKSYFWHRKSPVEFAADLDRVIDVYGAAWKRNDVILIGYSRGADVLPFALNRMTRRVRLAVLLAPSRKTSFEIHLTDYLSDGGGDADVVLELATSRDRVVCVFGSDETQTSACTAVDVRRRMLRGGHHFDGDYDELARLVLEEIRR